MTRRKMEDKNDSRVSTKDNSSCDERTLDGFLKVYKFLPVYEILNFLQILHLFSFSAWDAILSFAYCFHSPAASAATVRSVWIAPATTARAINTTTTAGAITLAAAAAAPTASVLLVVGFRRVGFGVLFCELRRSELSSTQFHGSSSFRSCTC